MLGALAWRGKCVACLTIQSNIYIFDKLPFESGRRACEPKQVLKPEGKVRIIPTATQLKHSSL
jgi:hypothetical protein